MGQINLFVSASLLLSLYFFIKSDTSLSNFVGGVFVGCGLLLKPFVITIVPFILLHGFFSDTKKLKLNSVSLKMLGVLLPNIINILIFLIFPILIQDFFITNFIEMVAADFNYSISITKLILNSFYMMEIEINRFLILCIVFIFTFSTSLIAYSIKRKKSEIMIIFAYLLGLLVTHIAYYDTWGHHFLILIPFLIIIRFILDWKNMQHSIFNRICLDLDIFFLSFFNFLFVILWFLIRDYFPWNFAGTIILIMLFCQILYLSLLKENSFLKQITIDKFFELNLNF
jgi:hypothetical protein